MLYADLKIWHLQKVGVCDAPALSFFKLRVVFDCSAKCNGKSFNDQLLSGPDLTNFLVAVLTRFRQQKIAVMADVESMFYQVRVAECHRKFLQFVWWPNGDTNAEARDYQMTVDPFGATR